MFLEPTDASLSSSASAASGMSPLRAWTGSASLPRTVARHLHRGARRRRHRGVACRLRASSSTLRQHSTVVVADLARLTPALHHLPPSSSPLLPCSPAPPTLSSPSNNSAPSNPGACLARTCRTRREPTPPFSQTEKLRRWKVLAKTINLS